MKPTETLGGLFIFPRLAIPRSIPKADANSNETSSPLIRKPYNFKSLYHQLRYLLFLLFFGIFATDYFIHRN